MINWFAAHGTSVSNQNRLISGDHKGLASYFMERHFKADYTSSTPFVAAFAQSDAGDASPSEVHHDRVRGQLICCRCAFDKAPCREGRRKPVISRWICPRAGSRAGPDESFFNIRRWFGIMRARQARAHVHGGSTVSIIHRRGTAT
jgi:hypothetical protein